MGENLPVRRDRRDLQQFEPVDPPTQGEIIPATRPPAPRPASRGGVARVWATVPASINSPDGEGDAKPVSIGQITATNVTIHVHGTTIQQHQEVVYGDRHTAVAASPPRAPDGPPLREPIGVVALICVVALAIAGAAFLAGCAWHAITWRAPSVVIHEAREPKDFMEYLKQLNDEEEAK
jgi:hypothetical protein